MKNLGKFTALALLVLLLVPGLSDSGTITKRRIGKQDIYKWDGVTGTFTATTSTGRTITMDKLDWPGVDVYGVYGSRTGTAISEAITAMGASDNATLWLSPGTWTLSADLTITANLALAVPMGAVIDTNGHTLTINGPFRAGLYQVFDTSGGGSVVFGSGSVSEIHPEWWITADTDAARASALQAAVTAAETKATVVLSQLYEYNSTLTIGASVGYIVLRGQGRSTGLKYTATDATDAVHLVYGGSSDVVREIYLENMTIQGNASSGDGVHVDNPARIVFRNIRIIDHGGRGVFLDRNTNYDFLVSFYDCWFNNNSGWGVQIDDGNAVNFYNCSWQGNGGELAWDGSAVSVYGGYIGGTTATSGGAVEVSGLTGATTTQGGGFFGTDFENNGTADAHIYVGGVNTVKGLNIVGCHFMNPGGASGDVSCIKAKIVKDLRIAGCNFTKSATYSGTVTGVEFPTGAYTVNGITLDRVYFDNLDTNVDNTGAVSYVQLTEDEMRVYGSADGQISFWQPGDSYPRIRLNGDATIDFGDGTTDPQMTLGRYDTSLLGVMNYAGFRLPGTATYPLQLGTRKILTGSGSPEGVVTAEPGSLYLNTDGGTGTTLYIKESGAGLNTGWVAK